MKEVQHPDVPTGLSATVSDVDAHKQFRESSERVSKSPSVVPKPRSVRSGLHSISDLIDAYMAAYAGRDPTRPHHLRWWQQRLGDSTLDTIDQDDIYLALEELSTRAGRYCAGRDADDKPIFKAKKGQYSPATINRYAAALSALFSWSIRKRLAPKAWMNPCRGIERRREDNERTRFLNRIELSRLLDACKASKWDRLYLLVLMAVSTGARRSELERLRWSSIDFERAEAVVDRTKNGDPRVLPLQPAVMSELARFRTNPHELIFASKRIPTQAFNHVNSWSRALKIARIRDFRFHDLRHTCASYLAQDGATLLQIGDVLGHRQVSVTRRYSHLTTVHRAALLSRVLGNIA